ncbi:MAG: hypothetical protein V9F00_14445 [Nocardioides sp.]
MGADAVAQVGDDRVLVVVGELGELLVGPQRLDGRRRSPPSAGGAAAQR